MYKCEDCGYEFDEPLSIVVNTLEFLGVPAEEAITVCPECKSTAWETYIENFNRLTVLQGNGQWRDVVFEEIEKGDIVKIYVDDNVVEEGTVMVTSDLYYVMNEPMFDCEVLTEEDIDKILEVYDNDAE